MNFSTLNRGDVLKLGYLDNLTGIVTHVEKNEDDVVYYFTVALSQGLDITYEPTRTTFTKIKDTISLIENVKEFRIFDVSGYSNIRFRLTPSLTFCADFNKHNAFGRAGSKMSIQRKTSLLTTASELWENKWFIQHNGGWDLNKFKNMVSI